MTIKNIKSILFIILLSAIAFGTANAQSINYWTKKTPNVISPVTTADKLQINAFPTGSVGCAQFDANNTLQKLSVACGSGGGGGNTQVYIGNGNPSLIPSTYPAVYIQQDATLAKQWWYIAGVGQPWTNYNPITGVTATITNKQLTVAVNNVTSTAITIPNSTVSAGTNVNIITSTNPDGTTNYSVSATDTTGGNASVATGAVDPTGTPPANTFYINTTTKSIWFGIGGVWEKVGTLATTNTLTSSVNTITSTVNGVPANAPAVNTVANSISAGQLTTSVNGVPSIPVTLPTPPATTNTLTNTTNTITSTVDGIVATAPAVNAVSGTLSGNTLTIGVNGVNSAPINLPSTTSVLVTAPIVNTGTPTAPNIGIADSGVTGGNYNNANVTVDSKGRITSASSGGAYGVVTSPVDLTILDNPATVSGNYSYVDPSGNEWIVIHLKGDQSRGSVQIWTCTDLNQTKYRVSSPSATTFGSFITSVKSVTYSGSTLTVTQTDNTVATYTISGSGGGNVSVNGTNVANPNFVNGVYLAQLLARAQIGNDSALFHTKDSDGTLTVSAGIGGVWQRTSAGVISQLLTSAQIGNGNAYFHTKDADGTLTVSAYNGGVWQRTSAGVISQLLTSAQIGNGNAYFHTKDADGTLTVSAGSGGVFQRTSAGVISQLLARAQIGNGSAYFHTKDSDGTLTVSAYFSGVWQRTPAGVISQLLTSAQIGNGSALFHTKDSDGTLTVSAHNGGVWQRTSSGVISQLLTSAQIGNGTALFHTKDADGTLTVSASGGGVWQRTSAGVISQILTSAQIGNSNAYFHTKDADGTLTVSANFGGVWQRTIQISFSVSGTNIMPNISNSYVQTVPTKYVNDINIININGKITEGGDGVPIVSYGKNIELGNITDTQLTTTASPLEAKYFGGGATAYNYAVLDGGGNLTVTQTPDPSTPSNVYTASQIFGADFTPVSSAMAIGTDGTSLWFLGANSAQNYRVVKGSWALTNVTWQRSNNFVIRRGGTGSALVGVLDIAVNYVSVTGVKMAIVVPSQGVSNDNRYIYSLDLTAGNPITVSGVGNTIGGLLVDTPNVVTNNATPFDSTVPVVSSNTFYVGTQASFYQIISNTATRIYIFPTSLDSQLSGIAFSNGILYASQVTNGNIIEYDTVKGIGDSLSVRNLFKTSNPTPNYFGVSWDSVDVGIWVNGELANGTVTSNYYVRVSNIPEALFIERARFNKGININGFNPDVNGSLVTPTGFAPIPLRRIEASTYTRGVSAYLNSQGNVAISGQLTTMTQYVNTLASITYDSATGLFTNSSQDNLLVDIQAWMNIVAASGNLGESDMWIVYNSNLQTTTNRIGQDTDPLRPAVAAIRADTMKTQWKLVLRPNETFYIAYWSGVNANVFVSAGEGTFGNAQGLIMTIIAEPVSL